MKRNLLLLVLLCLGTNFSYAKNKSYLLADCPDCFNFVAPTISGAETVSPAEIGLIVYDSYADAFRGYSATGTWQKLTTNKSARTVTANSVLTSEDDFIFANASAGAEVVTLPSAATVPGKEITIKKSDGTANVVTVAGPGTETISNKTSRNLSATSEMLVVVSDGLNWRDMYGEMTKAPTIQTFLTGAGTYVMPAGVKYLKIIMSGGGGGGGSNGGAGVSSATTGGNTTFGSMIANGGSGIPANQASNAAGGPASLGSTGAIGYVYPGGRGASGLVQTNIPGAAGGSNPLGGQGMSNGDGSGGNAIPNTGAGGAGAIGAVWGSVAGGSAGGYINAIIPSPESTYTYSVGAAGVGGLAGSNGRTGGAGGSGIIIVEEHYH